MLKCLVARQIVSQGFNRLCALNVGAHSEEKLEHLERHIVYGLFINLIIILTKYINVNSVITDGGLCTFSCNYFANHLSMTIYFDFYVVYDDPLYATCALPLSSATFASFFLLFLIFPSRFPCHA